MIATSMTFGELCAFRSHTQPTRPALRWNDVALSCSDLDAAATRTAHALVARGIGPGRRFGVLEVNTPDVVVLVLGAAKCGAVPVLLNWRLTAVEIDFILTDAGIDVLFVGDNFTSTAAQVETDLREVVELGNGLSLWLDAAEGADSEVPVVHNADATFLQLYTSGTTGHPKGACISHANLLSVVTALLMELPVSGSTSRNLVAAPLFHAAGIVWAAVALVTGAENVLLATFDPESALDVIETERITHALLVPAMVQAVLAVPDAADRDLSSLQYLMYGGSPMHVPTMRAASELFDCFMQQGYGLTETSGLATVLRWHDHVDGLAPGASGERLGSAGTPIAGAALRIVQPDGTDAVPGEPGEVWIRGPMVMSGYWNRDEANADAFVGEWFRTGDIGYIDAHGYLYLVDRLNDMIVSKGENVYPSEVERVLFAHEAIADIAVFGIPDDEFGEAVCAAIVPAGDDRPDLDQLREWAGEMIAGYKLPRHAEYVDDLPRNASGKVLRRDLRARYWGDRSRAVN